MATAYIRERASITDAIETIAGGMAIVVDDPHRENEGDLVMAAQHATPQKINFMIRRGRGLVCATLPRRRLDELAIIPMVPDNWDALGTAFHITVDVRGGRGSGASAENRATTARALAQVDSVPGDFRCPGHMVPLASRPGGVLERPGHTEASVDLAVLAGAAPAGVICEILSADGEMARLPELLEFGTYYDLPVVTIEDLVAYRRRLERIRKEPRSLYPSGRRPVRRAAVASAAGGR